MGVSTQSLSPAPNPHQVARQKQLCLFDRTELERKFKTGSAQRIQLRAIEQDLDGKVEDIINFAV